MHRLAAILPIAWLCLTVAAPVRAATDVPLPTLREDGAKEEKARPRAEEPPPPPPDQTIPPFDLAEAKACERELTSLRVRFKVLDPIRDNPPCGAERPLLLQSLPGGVKVPDGVTVRCEVALGLARWSKETVAPSAELHLGAKLTGVIISTSYQCRRRNNAPTGKFSEHAFANGVDVMGFSFDKRKPLLISVRNGESEPDRAFQAAVRGASCAYFTTVLGPTTNAAHANHLHLDLAVRRGGYRLCE